MVGSLEHGVLVFTLSQVLLLLALTVLNINARSLPQTLFAALLLAVLGYVVGQLVEHPTVRLLMAALATAIPGTFWLLSASLFDDNFELKRWQLGLIALTVVPPLLAAVTGSGGHWLLVDVPQALEFVLLGLAMWGVIWHWRTDLVQSRRYLRTWVCGVVGVYITLFIFLDQLLLPKEAWVSVWQNGSMAIIAFVTCLLAVQLKGGILDISTQGLSHAGSLGEQSSVDRSLAQPSAVSNDGPRAASQNDITTALQQKEAVVNEAITLASTSVAPKQISAELIIQLQHLMDQEHIYREMGLTIGQLAAKLNLPEYRLREAINAGLGYRNFNDYLNTYRINEAKARLVSPEEHSTPVLNIALDVGFRSLSSFNKAFKSSSGGTPTDYRKQAVSDNRP